jgi:gamma-glutamylcyclotransferase (GGCT)/AIG2-like uncharacterized protein YtfP
MLRDKKVFVYGTLKKGGGLHGYLRGNSDFVEERVIPGYEMFHLGWFPGIRKTKREGAAITGEVYLVNDEMVKTLDMVEGVPTLYTREVEGDVSLYVYASPDRMDRTGNLIEDGVFDVTGGRYNVAD